MSKNKLDKVEFKGEKRFLSNTYPAPFRVPNLIAKMYPTLNIDVEVVYKTSEHFYMAMKSSSKEYQKLITSQEEPREVQKIARKLIGTKYELRDYWEDGLKNTIMEIALYCKFGQNVELLERLDSVEGEIVERNYWKDTYWGTCEDIGENHLGKMLMRFRDDKSLIKRHIKVSFPRKKSFLPVIHVTDNIDNVFTNVDICIEADADGIFLISHGYKNYRELLSIGSEIKKKFPKLWIGYNFLDLGNDIPFLFIKDKVDGVWVDDTKCGVDNRYMEELASANIDYKVKHKCCHPNNTFFFGGVAFKYCKQPENIENAIKFAIPNMEAITTSGDGTGEAASLDKIKTISNKLTSARMANNTKLALASGVSAENVTEYLPYVDIFLVASSISVTHDLLDSKKTKELSNLIHGYGDIKTTAIEVQKDEGDDLGIY